METMMQRVGAAILLAEAQWNPKTARESKEAAMARSAIEAMREPDAAMEIAVAHAKLDGQNSVAIYQSAIDAALNPSSASDQQAL